MFSRGRAILNPLSPKEWLSFYNLETSPRPLGQHDTFNTAHWQHILFPTVTMALHIRIIRKMALYLHIHSSHIYVDVNYMHCKQIIGAKLLIPSTFFIWTTDTKKNTSTLMTDVQIGLFTPLPQSPLLVRWSRLRCYLSEPYRKHIFERTLNICYPKVDKFKRRQSCSSLIS